MQISARVVDVGGSRWLVAHADEYSSRIVLAPDRCYGSGQPGAGGEGILIARGAFSGDVILVARELASQMYPAEHNHGIYPDSEWTLAKETIQTMISAQLGVTH